MASTAASSLISAYLLLVHSISSWRKSNPAWRLKWRLSNFFQFWDSWSYSTHKSLGSLKHSLQAGWDSLQLEILRFSSKNDKKGLEAILEARGLFWGQTFFLNENNHRRYDMMWLRHFNTILIPFAIIKNKSNFDHGLIRAFLTSIHHALRSF